jgi:hypothetical protein
VASAAVQLAPRLTQVPRRATIRGALADLTGYCEELP